MKKRTNLFLLTVVIILGSLIILVQYSETLTKASFFIIIFIYSLIVYKILKEKHYSFHTFLCYLIPLAFISIFYTLTDTIAYDDPWFHLSFIKLIKQYGTIEVIPLSEQYNKIPGFHILFAIYSEATNIGFKQLSFIISIVSIVTMLVFVRIVVLYLLKSEKIASLVQLFISSAFYFYLIHIANYSFVYALIQLYILFYIFLKKHKEDNFMVPKILISTAIIISHALITLLLISGVFLYIIYEVAFKKVKRLFTYTKKFKEELYGLSFYIIVILLWIIYWSYYDVFHLELLIKYIRGTRYIGLGPFSSGITTYIESIKPLSLTMYSIPLFFDVIVLINIIECLIMLNIKKIAKIYFNLGFVSNRIIYYITLIFVTLGLSGYVSGIIPFPERFLYMYRLFGAIPSTLSVVYLSKKLSFNKQRFQRFIVTLIFSAIMFFSIINPVLAFHSPIAMKELAPLRDVNSSEFTTVADIIYFYPNNINYLSIYADNDIATSINYYISTVVNKEVNILAHINNGVFLSPGKLTSNSLFIIREIYKTRPVYARGIFFVDYEELKMNANLLYSRIFDSKGVLCYFNS